jgi:hypothetical protein
MSQHGADVPTATPLMDRRNFAAMALLLCAPAIVRASSLMPIKGGGLDPACVHMNTANVPSAGWAERVGYHMMDHVLETGWTPERAALFYGGMSESKMRSMVAHARRHGFLRRSA